jgi:hypothetical protein
MIDGSILKINNHSPILSGMLSDNGRILNALSTARLSTVGIGKVAGT